MDKKYRVVSYQRYIAHIMRKIALEIGVMMFFLFSGILTFVALCLGIATVVCVLTSRSYTWPVICSVLAMFCICGARVAFRSVMEVNDYTVKIEPCLPPTRYHIEHFAVEQVLLRAVQETSTPQEEILLRPASASDTTPKEELLRPHD